MKCLKSYLLGSSIVLVLSACTHLDRQACIERRGAVDVGSGSTKSMAAVVDVCEKKMVQVLHTDQTPLAFNESMERSSTQSFEPQIVAQGSEVIQGMVETLRKFEVKRVNAVATSAFRKSKNGASVAQQLGEDSKINLRVISQEEEAEIGIQSALLKISNRNPGEALVVWDIGGGSMQISLFHEGSVKTFQGDLASVSFKNRILVEIQKKNLKNATSPNPMKNSWTRAVVLAQEHARTSMSEDILSQAAKARWVGIGGVHWHSVRNQVGQEKKVFTQGDLEKALKQRASLTDSQIGGKYSSTEVSNLALVLGYMKALGIQSVEPIDATLVEGLLLQ